MITKSKLKLKVDLNELIVSIIYNIREIYITICILELFPVFLFGTDF